MMDGSGTPRKISLHGMWIWVDIVTLLVSAFLLCCSTCSATNITRCASFPQALPGDSGMGLGYLWMRGETPRVMDKLAVSKQQRREWLPMPYFVFF